MALPKAVLDAQKEADEMTAQLQAQSLGTQENPAPELPQNTQAQEPAIPQQTQEPQPQPQELEPQIPATQPVIDDALNKNYKQLYETLQGKYNAEVPRLAQEVRALKEHLLERDSKLNTLQTEMLTLRQQSQQATEPGRTDTQTQQPSQQQQTSGIDFEKIREGDLDEIANMAQLLSQQGNYIKALEQKLTLSAQQINQVAQDHVVNRQKSFEEQLSDLSPKWREIDSMPQFGDWLDGFEPLSAIPRRDNAAKFWGNDARRVADFYNAFQSQFLQANTAPPTQTPPIPQQVQQPTQTQQQVANPLESMVEPSRAGGADNSAQTQKRIYTAQEMSDFYDAYTKGHYRGKENDWMALERDMSLAVQEGRVRGAPTVGRFTPSDARFV